MNQTMKWLKRLFEPAEHPLVAREQQRQWLDGGLKGFPDCDECQCYPEGRNDCPEHMACRERLGLN